ncbi:MAG: ubiquinol-cytochrome c reductase iron-sulfur subunit [Anaerolineae bacterium]
MAAAQTQVPGISRREFLYYIWSASIALYLAEFAGLMIWFAIPIIREGEFGGIFPVDPTLLPGVNEPPVDNAAGRFWLVNLDTAAPEGQERMYQATDEASAILGVAAIYKVCTHLGCIYKWNDASNRFECPCHGSKYRLDGRRIQSPAPRSLDRFEMTLTFADDSTASSDTDEAGQFLPIPTNGKEVVGVSVNTGSQKKGSVLTLLQDLAV